MKFFFLLTTKTRLTPIRHTIIKMYIVFSKMNTLQRCWWCQNEITESATTEHVRNCLALKWVAQRKTGVPEDRITYHPHRNVRRFINEGWEEMGRREGERWREREERAPEGGREEKKGRKGKDRGAEGGGTEEERGGVETAEEKEGIGLPEGLPGGRVQNEKRLKIPQWLM